MSPGRLLAAAVLLAAAGLVAGVGGGLGRWGLPSASGATLVHHGALMVCGFLGTLIALERAVALRTGWPAPLLAGAGTLVLVAGFPDVAALAWLLAGIGLVALYTHAGLARAWSLHLAVQLAGAVAWPLGTWAWWHGDLGAATPAWMAFLLLTIAGERRELAQFVRLPAWARAVFVATVGAVLGAVVWRLLVPAHHAAAHALWWSGTAALALWLLRFDIAMRHWNAPQWRGHTARCLAVGHGWLLVASLLQLTPLAPVSNHVLLLGFVFAMVFGHAPIMLPALARLQPAYSAWAQVPLAVMGASLLLRMAGTATGDLAWLLAAGIGHVLAIALFAVVMVRAVLRGRAAARPRPARA